MRRSKCCKVRWRLPVNIRSALRKRTPTSIVFVRTRDSRRSSRRPKSGSGPRTAPQLLKPGSFQNLDLRFEHLALHRADALVWRDGRFENVFYDVHALGDVAEGGKTVRVSSRTTRVEAGHIRYQDEEVGPGGPGAGVGHGDRSSSIVKAGLASRLVRDRRVELARVGGDPALDQPAISDMHRAVEVLAVKAMGIDVVEEIGG